jgi:putative colanic acid biosynthesis acetyltransferase WcaF
MNPSVDVRRNRSERKWTTKELIGRSCWALAQPVFRYSPRICWRWRTMLLRMFGAEIGQQVHISPSVVIAIPWNLEIGDWSSVGFDVLIYNLGKITIGRSVTISQRSHLCGGSHDYSDAAMPLMKSPITIEDNAWVCADAFVGPGVTIGEGAVLGARAVAIKDIPAWSVATGNPARTVKRRELKS